MQALILAAVSEVATLGLMVLLVWAKLKMKRWLEKML